MALYDKPTDSLNISLICDQLKVDTQGLNVVANVHLWSQLLPHSFTTWPVTLRPNGVQYDKIIPINDILKGEYNRRNAFLELQLRRDKDVISKTYYFPSSLRSAIGMEDPELEVN